MPHCGTVCRILSAWIGHIQSIIHVAEKWLQLQHYFWLEAHNKKAFQGIKYLHICTILLQFQPLWWPLLIDMASTKGHTQALHYLANTLWCVLILLLLNMLACMGVGLGSFSTVDLKEMWSLQCTERAACLKNFQAIWQ